MRSQFDWALARGSLLKGVRAMTWDRPEEGRRHFADAAKRKAAIDEGLLRKFADELFNYEFEFGAEKAQVVWQRVNEGFQAIWPSLSPSNCAAFTILIELLNICITAR